jgi:hypothetical protein
MIAIQISVVDEAPDPDFAALQLPGVAPVAG